MPPCKGPKIIFKPHPTSESRTILVILRYYFYYSMAPILELRNLVKHFPGQQAVREISLAIPRGSFFSLLGPSGCGKTTTLRLIAGFEQPTSGDILLDGEIVNQRKPYERNVSTVFQNYALFPHLTARANVEFGLKRHRATDIDARVREVLQLVGLTGKETRRPAQLSGGERQRVALARSLVLQPDVLLLDEPLAALDPKLRKQMRVELKAMQRRAGVTFLLVTHDQEEALSMSDHLAVMNEGRIEQVGSPEDVYLRPRSRFVAGFLGAVNWISGAGIRPEAVRLLPAGPADNVTPGDATPGDATPGDATRDRRVPGVVTGTVFLGDCVQVLVRLSSGEDAVAQLPRRAALFQPGDAVQFTWSAADEMTFP
jgi:ABC-type Fe3+/spermidine/putrescine transport system ATPase subunit